MTLMLKTVIVLWVLGQICTGRGAAFPLAGPEKGGIGARSLGKGQNGPNRGGNHVHALQLVGKGKLNTKELIRRARGILREHAGASFILVWFLETDADRLAFFPPRPVLAAYPVWRLFYDQIPGRSLAVGRLLAFDGSAVLQVREGNGNVKRYVLQGQDLLWWNVGVAQVELLDVILRQRPVSPVGTTVGVYARTGAPLTEQLGWELWRRLRDRLPFVDMWLSIRQDSWFVTDSSALVVYPFDEESRPPTEMELAASYTLHCFEDYRRREVKCWLHKQQVDTGVSEKRPAFPPPPLPLSQEPLICIPSPFDHLRPPPPSPPEPE